MSLKRAGDELASPVAPKRPRVKAENPETIFAPCMGGPASAVPMMPAVDPQDRERELLEELKELKAARARVDAEAASKKAPIAANKKRVVDELVRVKNEMHSDVYTIRATPGDKRHVAHNVGCFSTAKKARSFIPVDGSSQDGRVTWSYTVLCEVATPSDFERLDEGPGADFPYNGW